MLVLTRKSAETIHIGDDIVIKVIKTGSGSVKIGIDAPAAIRVIRGELVEEPQLAKVEPADEVEAASGWMYGGIVSDQFPHVA